jgi:hypothetical protein
LGFRGAPVGAAASTKELKAKATRVRHRWSMEEGFRN